LKNLVASNWQQEGWTQALDVSQSSSRKAYLLAYKIEAQRYPSENKLQKNDNQFADSTVLHQPAE
jgi:hypothetical protein